MKKRFLTILLCGCMAMGMITGCGAADDIAPAETLVAQKYDYEAEQESIAEEEAKKVDYSIFEGNYSDSFSQRAVAEVSANGTTNAKIVVYWASGATEMNRWEMTATFEDNKLSYTNCKLEIITTDDEGAGSSTMLYDDGTGYFLWDAGLLKWTGASDESCRDCVFVKDIVVEE